MITLFYKLVTIDNEIKESIMSKYKRVFSLIELMEVTLIISIAIDSEPINKIIVSDRKIVEWRVENQYVD